MSRFELTDLVNAEIDEFEEMKKELSWEEKQNAYDDFLKKAELLEVLIVE